MRVACFLSLIANSTGLLAHSLTGMNYFITLAALVVPSV